MKENTTTTPTVYSVDALPEQVQALYQENTVALVGQQTGFIRRKRKLTALAFFQICTLGFMVHTQPTFAQLAQDTARCNCAITPQSVSERFTKSAADFLLEMLRKTVKLSFANVKPKKGLFDKFTAVKIHDSTCINLNIDLIGEYKGCGSSHGPSAGMKIQVSFDVKTGALMAEEPVNASIHDRNSLLAYVYDKGALYCRDLGYLKMKELEICDAAGAYFVTRVNNTTAFYGENGQRMGEIEYLRDGFDSEVWISQKQRMKVRMVVIKVPADIRIKRLAALEADGKRRGQPVSGRAKTLAGWDIRITNAPETLLSIEEVYALSRIRWQIELIFKLWKSCNFIDEVRSENKWRVLCEIYGKLISVIIQHWILVATVWENDERSLTKAARVIREQAILLWSCIHSVEGIRKFLENIRKITQVGCKVERRKKNPSAFQVIEQGFSYSKMIPPTLAGESPFSKPDQLSLF
jgi:Transposase DDE domain